MATEETLSQTETATTSQNTPQPSNQSINTEETLSDTKATLTLQNAPQPSNQFIAK